MEQLRKNIEAKVRLTDEDFEKLASYFRPRIIKKKKDLCRIGEYCKDLAFVKKGAFRSYSIDDKGNEHVLQLALENYWISDLYSFLSHEPSTLYVEAIEDSEVLLISTFDLDRIYLEVPVMERFFRKLMERAYVATLKRINTSFSKTAKERYLELIKNQPDISRRIPLIYIASFLGITPESLSRIRKQI